MGGFTKTVVFEIDFDGDHVVIEFERLKKEDQAVMMPFGTLNSDGSFTPDQSKIVEANEAINNLLEKRLISMTGITDAEGNELTFTQIKELYYFNDFLAHLFIKLSENSSIKVDDAKKS